METTLTIARRLVDLYRQGQFVKAQEELYADDVLSLQPASALFEARLEGREAIVARERRLQQLVTELRVVNVSEPIVAEHHFSLAMTTEVTLPGLPARWQSEIGVYEVREGKIVVEQFFF